MSTINITMATQNGGSDTRLWNTSHNESYIESDDGEYFSGAGLMPGGAKIIVTLMYSCVVIVAVGGNVIVCGIVITQKRMRTVTNYFLVSLAVSDIAMATLCIPFTFVANVLVMFWPFGAELCPVMLYSQTATVFLSAFTMLSISVDRFRAVIFPLKPKLTTRATLIIILVTWVLALGVSLPTAVQSKVEPRMTRDGLERDFCDEVWAEPEQRYAYSVLVMILQYFVPLAFLAFTYASIGLVIWVKRAPGEAENNRDRRLAASKRKMVKMMVTVVVLYALCWLPIHALTIIGDLHPNIWKFHHIQSVWVACHWLAMSNSCYNPIVYCWMNAKFRNGFRYVFRKCPFVRYDPLAHGGLTCSKTSVVVHSYISTCPASKLSSTYGNTSGYSGLGSGRRGPSYAYSSSPACSPPGRRRCNGELGLQKFPSGSCYTESYLLSPMGSDGRSGSPYSSRGSDRTGDGMKGSTPHTIDSSSFDYVDHLYRVPNLENDTD